MNTINNEFYVLEHLFQFSSTMNKYFLEKMAVPKLISLHLTHLAITICYESCWPTLCIIFLFDICILLDLWWKCFNIFHSYFSSCVFSFIVLFIFMFLQIFMMNQLCNEFLTNHSIEKSNDVLPRLIALTIPNQLFNLEAFKSSLTMPSHHLHPIIWSFSLS